MGLRLYLQTAFYADQARTLLGHVARARTAVHGSRHEESLHDWRVLVRRLIETTRTWSPAAARPALLELARPWIEASNTARDHEAEQAMLQGLMEEADAPTRERLARYIESQRAAAETAFNEILHYLVRPEQAEEERRLAEQLDQMPRFPARPRKFPPRLVKALARLQKLLAERNDKDPQALHRLRLAAKKVRYGLEPLADLDRAVKPVLAELTALQRALGDNRDWHRLAGKFRAAKANAAIVTLAERQARKCLEAAPRRLPATEELMHAAHWQAPAPDPKVLRQRLLARFDDAPFKKELRQAIALTTRLQQSRERADGSPYVIHPLRVALCLAEEAGVRDARSLALALLHDLPARATATAFDGAAWREEVATAAAALGHGGDSAKRPCANGERLRAAAPWVRVVALAELLETLRYHAESGRRKKTARLAERIAEEILPALGRLRSQPAQRLQRQFSLLIEKATKTPAAEPEPEPDPAKDAGRQADA